METSPTTRPDTAPAGSGTKLSNLRSKANPLATRAAQTIADRVTGRKIVTVLDVAAFQSSI